jgi:acetyl-CoA carboxylase carboxyl transferase subunit beta
MSTNTNNQGNWFKRFFNGNRKLKNQNSSDERFFVKKEHSCPNCGVHLDDERFLDNQYVCYNCNHHFRISVAERMSFLADNGEYQEFCTGITSRNPIDFPEYDQKLEQARAKTGNEDAIKNFRCRIFGKEAVIVVMNFAFMGGSMGSVVGEKITQALLEGAENHLPVILFSASGGARMQEGIYSLMQMAKTSHAIALLDNSGMPFFVTLTDPTTGGVTASFAMLGDVILAEPGALIGFAGARVIEGTIKQKLPEGFQRAEFQRDKGFVDMVVSRRDLKKTLAFLIETHTHAEGVRK